MQSKRQTQQQPKSSYTNYGDPFYWDRRYKKSKGQRFDWLENYDTLQELIEKFLKHNKKSKILNIGCGNGQIQDRLYQGGYNQIINNDISSIVIEEMIQIKKKKGYDKMIYEIMDVRTMRYQNEQFDMVLDKSTIDALLCSDTPLVSVAMMLKQVYRVLKIGGIYFMISYGMPGTRMQHLTRQHISFQIDIIQLTRQLQQNGGKLTHFVYICKKKPMKTSFQQQDYEKMLQYLKKLQEDQCN